MNDQERLKLFTEEALKFFYKTDGIMLSPHRGAEFERLHQSLFELVRDGVIKNVVAAREQKQK